MVKQESIAHLCGHTVVQKYHQRYRIAAGGICNFGEVVVIVGAKTDGFDRSEKRQHHSRSSRLKGKRTVYPVIGVGAVVDSRVVQRKIGGKTYNREYSTLVLNVEVGGGD